MRMKGMTEFQLRFLVGVIIAVLIGFGIFYIYIHNAQDREVEATGYRFKEEIAAVCEDGKEREMSFELPQPWVSSLKDKVEDVLNTAKKKLGIGGPELKIPLQAFNDPYYKIYWEIFPPEPPYYFLQDIPGTLASVFIPWSEDLPWSSNFFVTFAIDSAFLGIDILGIKEVKAFGKDVANTIVEKLESISPETFEKLREIWSTLEQNGDAIIDKLGRASDLTIRGGKFVLHEGVFVGKVTAAYTVFCLGTQDKTLDECLKEGVILGIGTDVAKVVMQQLVWPKIETYVKSKILEVKTKFSLKLDDLKEMFGGQVDHIVDSDTMIETLKADGLPYDEITGNLIAKRESGGAALENIINPLEEYAKENGYPTRIDVWDIVYGTDEQGNKIIEQAIYDRKGLVQTLKQQLLMPLEQKLGNLEESTMADRFTASPNLVEELQIEKNLWDSDPEGALKLVKSWGYEVEDTDAALRIVAKKYGQAVDLANNGLLFEVDAIGSNRDNLFANLDNLYATSGKRYSDMEGYVNEYKNIVLKDPDEAKKLLNLLDLKLLRIKEDAEIFSRGTFGYMLLRIQDLYTPLGATYWDKYYSAYGYEPIRQTPQGYCQTKCDDGMICVQLGACVRQYDLPESCVARGVTSINLRRNSLVAKDPRLYLVSPCESKLKIKLEGETIFIEPYMSENPDKKNYCYATAGLVNWYVGIEAGEYAVRCLTSALCAVTTGVGTMDTIKACIGFGKGFTGPCSVVSNLAGLLIDLYRETQLVWPTVYMSSPDLIDFKITSTSTGGAR